MVNSYLPWFDAATPEVQEPGPVTRFEPDPEPAWTPRQAPRGAETVPVDAPPAVYLPCVRPTVDGDVEVQTRVMRDGQIALLAYTALDRLTAYCGPSQPWVLVATEQLDEIDRVFPFDVVLLDLPVPHHARIDGGGTR